MTYWLFLGEGMDGEMALERAPLWGDEQEREMEGEDSPERMDEVLSSLGMLSESCKGLVSEEDREMLRHHRHLASLASQQRKEREKKAKDSLKSTLLDRKREVEAKTRVSSQPRQRDCTGRLVSYSDPLMLSSHPPYR